MRYGQITKSVNGSDGHGAGRDEIWKISRPARAVEVFVSRSRAFGSRPAGVPGRLVHVSIYYIYRNMRRPKSSAAPSTHTPSSTHSSSSASISHASTSGCPIQFFTRRSARAVLSIKRFRFFVINNEACLLVSFLPPPVQYGPPLIARLKESCGITAILRFLLSHKFRELFQEYGIVGQL
jgi:hypothetical protein